jgi:hypothetical protein
MSEEEDYVPYDYSMGQDLVGKIFTFDDGDSIEVIQVKRRDTGPWVTYHIIQGSSIPRKMVMSLEEFMNTYGHLFK